MAAAGKTGRGKTSSSAARKGTKKTTSSTAKRSSGSRASGSKNTTSKKTPVYDFPIVREIIVLVCVALAVILFISSFDSVSSDLGWLKQVNFGLFGWFGYASALVIIFLAFFVAANIDHFGTKPKMKVAGVALFVVAVCGFLQAVQIHIYDYTMPVLDYFTYGYEEGGGGLIGGAVMKLFYPFLGKIGSAILLFFVILISLMIVTEISFQDIAKWIRTASDKHKEKKQLQKEQEEEYLAQRQKRQEEAERARLAAEKNTAKTGAKAGAATGKGGKNPIANVDLKKDSRTGHVTGTAEKQGLDQKRGKASGDTEISDSSIQAAAGESASGALNANASTSVSDAPVQVDENRKNAFFEWIQQRRKEEKRKEEAQNANQMAASGVNHEGAVSAQNADTDTVSIGDTQLSQLEGQPGIYQSETDSRVLHASSNGGSRQMQKELEMPKGTAVQTVMPLSDQEGKENSQADYNPYADFPQQTATADKYSNTAYTQENSPQGDQIVVQTASGKKIVVERDTVVAPTKKRTIAYTGSPEKEAAAAAAQAPKPAPKPYVAPALRLLKRTEPGVKEKNRDMELAETAALLEQTFRDFGVGVEVTDYSCGPTVTRYELTPAQGVKVSRITALTDDVKLKLAATDIRIEAPIPGKSAVGIEVPNKENSMVLLGDLIGNSAFQKHPSKLAFAVGKDIGGKVIVFDIARMPHLLIAGATGSGKSVCINTLIMSILYKATPEEVKLIMIDPKVVELSVYSGIPHLAKPVVTDARKASGVLNWAVAEMTRRYHKFAETNTRDIAGYNNHIAADESLSEDEKKAARLPQMVIIVDELADLMMVAPGEVEDAICRLAQMARAAGIHLVLATQRPSVNVITGLIKANVPSRIAFSVSSGVDSRTIIDMNGAEKLLGKGDMLFYPFGYNKPVRVQGAFVSDQEVSAVVESMTKANDSYVPAVEYDDSFEEESSEEGSGTIEVDEYFAKAGLFLIEKEKGSIGMLQRMFRIGFNRAARIMDQLAEYGVVGEEDGTKPRQILMTQAEFETFLSENGLS